MSNSDIIQLVAVNVGLSLGVVVAVLSLTWLGMLKRIRDSATQAREVAESSHLHTAAALRALTALSITIENQATLLSFIRNGTSVDDSAINETVNRDSLFVQKTLQEIRLLSGESTRRHSAAQQLASGLGDFQSIELLEWATRHYDDGQMRELCLRLKDHIARSGVWHSGPPADASGRIRSKVLTTLKPRERVSDAAVPESAQVPTRGAEAEANAALDPNGPASNEARPVKDKRPEG